MSERYAADDFDLGITASPLLPRAVRLSLILLGLLLVPFSLPLAYMFAVISGGGHGSPFDGGPAEFAFGVTILIVPVLVLALGIACLACTNRLRLKIVIGLATAIPLTFALAIYFGHLASRPPDYSHLKTKVPPNTDPRRGPLDSIGMPDPNPEQVVTAGGGKPVSVDCNSVSGVCAQSEDDPGTLSTNLAAEQESGAAED